MHLPDLRSNALRVVCLMYRVIVAGSRSFNDYTLLKHTLDSFLSGYLVSGIVIVSGMARGADTLGERYAQERGFQLVRHPAKWHEYGRSAGYKRNEEMASCANALVAFWDEKSKGTKHMIDIAKRKGLEIHVVTY